MSESPTGNRQLERMGLVLDALDFGEATASELARRTGLSVSTTHRLALSMAEYDFLSRSSTGEFSLGRRFVRSRLESISLDILTKLRDDTGETAQLWIRRGDERVCIITVDSTQELKATLPRGSRLHLPHGSSGRLLSLDPEALDSVQDQGWVESVGRRTAGLGSVSAPVNSNGQMIASLCLAMPLSRCEVSPGEDHGALVVAAARRVGAALAR